jgi:magnesium-protoporphyrin IX monomethyl ester (oxidative) cyclase
MGLKEYHNMEMEYNKLENIDENGSSGWHKGFYSTSKEFKGGRDSMKILLINPPWLISKKSLLLQKYIDVFQPLGLAYVAAMLETHGYTVSILDAIAENFNQVSKLSESDTNLYYIGMSFEEIREYVKEKRPDIVGITIPFTAQSQSAFKVAGIVKKVNEDIITIAGGPHASVNPIDCLKHAIDFIIIGEGEYSSLELVREIENQKPILNKAAYKNIKGIAFLDGGKPYITPRRPPILDLDLLPHPARHLLPMKKYFKAQKEHRYSRHISERNVSVFTSRGCPFNCIFCSIHLTMGKKWRGRSPKNVVDEIEHLIKKYTVTYIEFEDDNITFDRNRMKQISDEIIRRGLQFKWRTPNGVRADTLDEELLKKMKAAGCEELWFAPESGVQRVIDEVINKRIKLDKIIENINICLKIGIKVNCFFVIGLPGETKEEIKKTLTLAQKLKKKGVGGIINMAIPLYGTRLYKIAREKEYLRNTTDEDLLYNNTLYMDTPEFTAEEVFEFFKEGVKIQSKISFRELINDISIQKVVTNLTHPRKLLSLANKLVRQECGV